MPHIVVLGTCDTKLEELLYLRAQLLDLNDSCKVTLVDVGRSPVQHEFITITQDTLISIYSYTSSSEDMGSLPRGELVKFMISCASNWLREAYHAGLQDPEQAGLHGIISAGGTGNTSLAAAVMREVLPIGFPKLIVSTAASGDTGPIVGESDITLTYSVVDVSGSNSLLRRILSNAAGGILGMATSFSKSLDDTKSTSVGKSKKRVGLTMFGVTTPCCDAIRSYLESNYDIECFVFHCTGHGGKAMERVVEQGELDAVLDITTTEICDHLVGGVMSAGEHRLEAALRAGIPTIISVGATDMVNFGPRATVPEKFATGRLLFEHNPTVTLMRTSKDECVAVGHYIAEKIDKFAKSKKNVKVVLPLGGVSMIATPDGPFYDAEADEAILGAIRNGLKGSEVQIIEDARAINDEGFATDAAKQLVDMMGL